MAHVAAPSSLLSAMPSHIWQSHPSPANPQPAANLSHGDHLPPTVSTTTTSTPLATSSPSHIWPLLPTSSPAQHSDLPIPPVPNSSPLPHPSNSSSVSELDPSPADADAVFLNLLNLQIDAPAQHHAHLPCRIHRSVSVHAPPFHPASTPTQDMSTRLTSASLNDLRLDPPLHHPHHFIPPSTSMSSSLLPPLPNSPPSLPIHNLYTADHSSTDHPSLPDSSPVLRPSSVPLPSSSQDLHSLLPSHVAFAQQNNQTLPRIKNELYKTEICRSFAETGGYCKYGSKCQFAHGDAELRPVRRHPRYKTKLCRNFVTTGTCPYDARCRFIHASDLPYSQASSNIAGPVNASALMNTNPQSVLTHSHTPLLNHHHHIQSDDLNAQPRDNYVDNLHRLFTLSSSPGTHHLESVVNNTTINADQRSISPQGDSQTDKPPISVLPTDQVYHANVFEDYPDNNAFHQTFMHLNNDNDLRFLPASALSDQDPLHSLHVGTQPHAAAALFNNDGNIGRHFTSALDSQNESLFSLSAPTPRSALASSAMPNGSMRPAFAKASDLFVEPSTSIGAAPAPSPTSRSRLPVFRNMASDDDDL